MHNYSFNYRERKLFGFDVMWKFEENGDYKDYYTFTCIKN